jgi:hypothetical protein
MYIYRGTDVRHMHEYKNFYTALSEPLCQVKMQPMPMHLLLLLFLSLAFPLQPMVVRASPSSSSSSSSSSPRHDCPSKCGDVSIEYPFGIGPFCAMEKGFELHCNESQSQDGRRSSTAYFSDGDLPVLADILLLHGQVRVMSSVASMCPNNRSTTYLLNLSGTPFTLAEKENMFTVIGVDAIGLMAGSRQSAIVKP